MRRVFLVKQEEADFARRIESKLITLPISTGVLFVGVSVRPATATNDRPTYDIWIGCHRDFDDKLMDPLVRVVLAEEIRAGALVTVEAHRGLSRSAIKSVDKET